MALNTKLNMAVKPLWVGDIVSRCTWTPLEGMKNHWLVSYKGTVFGEMWKGKAGIWALLYTYRTNPDGTKYYTAKVIFDRSARYVQLALAGAVFNGRT